MTDTNALYNILISSKIKPVSNETIKECIRELREVKGLTWMEISKQTGFPKTTCIHKLNPQKNTNCKSFVLNLENIIAFFDDFIPQGKEVEKVEKLINQLVRLVEGT